MAENTLTKRTDGKAWVVAYQGPAGGGQRYWQWCHAKRMCRVTARLGGWTGTAQWLTAWWNTSDRCVGCGRWINWTQKQADRVAIKARQRNDVRRSA